MLIGFIGDIHGNIEALEAMYSRLMEHGVEKIICTGDVVGYGASPGECIDFIRNHKIPTVCGNHDSYTVHPELERDGIREEALEVFQWNRKVLTKDQMDWLRHLPLKIDTKLFTVHHGSCVPFPTWDYVLGERSASLHFLYQNHSLCFNGHSHVPVIGLHQPGGRVNFMRLHNMLLPRGMDVMVGVGAVGQPRDGDPRACGVIYDTVGNRVTVLRVDYDILTAQQKILDAGLPEFLAYRLTNGR